MLEMRQSFAKGFFCFISALLLAGCYTQKVPEIRSFEDARQFCPQSMDFNSYSYLSKIDMWGLISPGPNDVWISSRLDFKQTYEMTEQMKRFWRLWNLGMAARGVDYTVAILPQRGLLVDYSAYAPSASMPGGRYNAQAALQSYLSYVANWPIGGPRVIDLYPILSPIGETAYYPRDHHWTQQTAANAATAIASRLKQVPAIARLPEGSYPMRSGDIVDLGVSFQDNILRECGVRYPNNPGIEYRTRGRDEGFSAGTYLSVVGNSNTNSLQGFDEWLRHGLSRPVEDNHIPGHHMHWSMFNLVHNQMNAQWHACRSPSGFEHMGTRV